MGKNKEKILSSLEEEQNVTWQKLWCVVHESLHQAVFEWFLNIRSQNVHLAGAIIQEKVSSHAKVLNIECFKASGGWLRRWKLRRNITFKNISGELDYETHEMVNTW